MKQKWPLFAGILFLIIGILLKKVFEINLIGLITILVGVALKTYYVVNKAIIGEYRPGFELLFLFVGLSLFLSRNFLHMQIELIPAGVFMGVGISLKIVFIILFIKKTKATEKTNIVEQAKASQ